MEQRYLIFQSCFITVLCCSKWLCVIVSVLFVLESQLVFPFGFESVPDSSLSLLLSAAPWCFWIRYLLLVFGAAFSVAAAVAQQGSVFPCSPSSKA
jgi:hypothetical protein